MSHVSHAHIETERPGGRYLQQLCKHFAHKLPVEFTPDLGRISFPTGVCYLAAEGSMLRLNVLARNEMELVQLEDVVARHLERFAFREPLAIQWVRTGAER
ncbi:DUF2218 domain-containing protein [Caulobacter sp. CCUG 60055]|uniref:DUF2218 domain-containing protein n=1 Tax=Caulobacter sp. CCUG 60055 TaxID=2100090 RepID=UPI001FA6B4AC|nr:DUF2218 domain-containing protein [Caulobacter sp. CCUG 60055]MBQ1541899.1 DUF2218 domain-containing protein [Caulobacteraceae bacterium]MCI3181246.1 DUF2218 domain-containing protein [Caulobacter sp. CCUG 60055]